MRENLGEGLPEAIPLLTEKAPGLLLVHGRSRKRGRWTRGPAPASLLGTTLATGSSACVKAMAHRAKGLGISKEELLETLKIACQAQANAVLGHATSLLEVL
ncbi:carboxymuconolactone decarboxylase family protein [Thermus hydrothermalis]